MATYAVLGGTGGIGSALTRRLASGDHDVLVAARNQERIDALTGEFDRVHGHACDATSFEAVERCLQAAKELGDGQLDGVALCVGSILLRPAHATSFEDWQETIALNLTSAFAVVRAAAKTMRKGAVAGTPTKARVRTALRHKQAREPYTARISAICAEVGRRARVASPAQKKSAGWGRWPAKTREAGGTPEE